MFASHAILASLVLPCAALAQAVPPPAPVSRAMAGGSSTPSSTRVVFEGFVLEPGGAPAEGAVVVTSAGGRAVTDAAGSYRLEADVPGEATSLQITAVGGAGRSMTASTSRRA